MTDYGGENVQAFANIFNMLAAKPLLRIGGSSQDLMVDLPGPEVWTALKRLHQATNCRCAGNRGGEWFCLGHVTVRDKIQNQVNTGTAGTHG
jgi:hypothetical protein